MPPSSRHTASILSLAVLITSPLPVIGATLAKVRLAPDGSGFQTTDGKPFVPFGLTYFRPNTGWAPQVWKQFDPQAIGADFKKMRAMGVNVVRVFLSYGSFASGPGILDPSGLEKLDQFLALAEEVGLYVHPTGLDHWEGTPSWAHADRYSDEAMLKAQEAFWAGLAARYRGRSVIWAYDLLNEPELRWEIPSLQGEWNRWLEAKYASPSALANAWGRPVDSLRFGSVSPPRRDDESGSPELLDYQMFRESVADAWTRRQVTAIKAADPDALVTIGLIQWSVPCNLAGSWQYAAFRPEHQAALLDFSEVHFYPLDGGAYQYNDPEAERRNLAYAKAVVDAVACAGKPVVLAEFGWYGGGAPHFGKSKWRVATEEDQACWCRQVVTTTAGSAVGWLNWGLYDHPEAQDVTQLSGLLTVDGKPKAWGQAFSDLAAEFNAKPPRFHKPENPLPDWDDCITSAKARAAARARLLTLPPQTPAR